MHKYLQLDNEINMRIEMGERMEKMSPKNILLSVVTGAGLLIFLICYTFINWFN